MKGNPVKHRTALACRLSGLADLDRDAPIIDMQGQGLSDLHGGDADLGVDHHDADGGPDEHEVRFRLGH